MLTRELRIYKARFGIKKIILSLVLEEKSSVNPSSGQFQYDDMPKAQQKTSMDPEEEVEVMDIEEAEPEEASLHGTSNPREAKEHVHFLDKAIETMETKIKEEEVKEVMKGTLECFKEVITKIIPTMAEANMMAILRATIDPRCMALRPPTEDTEQILEEIMPDVEIPSGSNIIAAAGNLEPLTEEQKELITELMTI